MIVYAVMRSGYALVETVDYDGGMSTTHLINIPCDQLMGWSGMNVTVARGGWVYLYDHHGACLRCVGRAH